MTIEANKRVMKQFLVFINTASEALATELISPDAIFHVPGRPEPLQGPSGYLALIGMMRGGFPDIQWTLEETIAEGDKIAARFTMRGTHQGTFLGIPPTGRKIEDQGDEFLWPVRRTIRRRAWPAGSARRAAADRRDAELTTVQAAA